MEKKNRMDFAAGLVLGLVFALTAALSFGLVASHAAGNAQGGEMSEDALQMSDEWAEMHETNGNSETTMTGMMQGRGMMGMPLSAMHDSDDIAWMKEEMKEHMGLTDEEIEEMTDHCPMMQGST